MGGKLVVFALDGCLEHSTQHLGIHHGDGHGVGSASFVAHALGIEQFLVDIDGTALMQGDGDGIGGACIHIDGLPILLAYEV